MTKTNRVTIEVTKILTEPVKSTPITVNIITNLDIEFNFLD